MNRTMAVRALGSVAAVLALMLAVRAGMAQFRPGSRQIPTARVRRGKLEIKLYSFGEVRPSKSVNLMAPPVSGALQIIRLAPTGSKVKPGDIVIEFDPSEQQYKLEQSRSEVQEAEEQITKSMADAEVSAAEDKVSLLKARFDVRRAELDAGRSELLSAIDAEKARLALEEARQRLAQLQQDVKSRVASNQAALAVLAEKRNKSRLAMKQAQTAIETMKLKSQIGGTVVIKENADAVGGWTPPGIVAPEYRQGDVVRPGRVLAEVLETENMEVQAKINETDRANVTPGQPVQILVDAIPELALAGKVKAVAGLVTREWGPQQSQRYDATFQIDKPDARIRPGQTAQVIINAEEVKNAVFLPRQAMFEKNGRPVLYVKNGSKFAAREVKITHRTESQVTVEGVGEGEEVALVNPEKTGTQPPKGFSGPVTGGGRP